MRRCVAGKTTPIPLGRRRGLVVISRSGNEALAALTPRATRLHPNYPNPFSPETRVPYQLREAAYVMLTIYDASGRVVRRLEPGYRPAGYYWTWESTARWDGRNGRGERVSSGGYFVELRAGHGRTVRRMVLLK